MRVLIAYNEPTLPQDSPDRQSEAGVLESVTSVGEALARRGHRVDRLAIRSLDQLVQHVGELSMVDVVFNLFEGFGGVGRGESEVAGLFELAGRPITGSPLACLAMTRDKPRTKWLLAGAGVPTAPFVLVPAVGELDLTSLDTLLAGGPLFVKPAHEDGSLGIGPESIVTDGAALARQVEFVRHRYGAVLVERFIVGREFNAAIVDFGQPELLPLAEIEFCGHQRSGWQIVTYDAKWAADSEADRTTPSRCPAQLDTQTAARIGHVALDAFRLCGCRGYARVDMRMDAGGNVYVLEVNANPDIGPDTGFRKALGAAGITFDDFVERLTRSAIERHAR